MGMNEEIRFIHLDNIDELRINTLEQQIKSYKDREDKLRSAITKLSKNEYIELFANEYVRSCLDDFLQILNEEE